MVDRRSYIGGADAAAVVGVGLWGSPYSVWASKVGLTEEDPGAVSERMQWGLLLERPVAEEWAKRNGVTGLRKAPFRRHEIRYIGGHPDFLAFHPTDGDIVIETKLSDRASEWEGDEVPLQYFLQVQHYLLITGCDVGYLVVLLRGNELRSFRIERDSAVIAGLLLAYDDFWRNHVEPEIAPEPDGHEATAEALKRRFPRGEDSEMVADLPMVGLIEGLIAVRREVKEAGEREAVVANRIRERMGSVSRVLSPVATISWKNNKDSEKTDWQSVAKAYRTIVQEIAEEERLMVQSSLHRQGVGRIEDDGLEAAFDALESIHTNTIPGARVFRVSIKSEE